MVRLGVHFKHFVGGDRSGVECADPVARDMLSHGSSNSPLHSTQIRLRGGAQLGVVSHDAVGGAGGTPLPAVARGGVFTTLAEAAVPLTVTGVFFSELF